MKLIQYDQNNQVFFISGMFAGSWTWDRCRKGVLGKHIFVQDPLMAIGGDVFKIIKILSNELAKLDQPVTLVGNSLGGYIALALAKHRPEKVKKVIISGSAGFSKLHLDIKDCLRRNKVQMLSERLESLICYKEQKNCEKDRLQATQDLSTYFRNMLGLFKCCNMISSAEMLNGIKCDVKAIWGDKDIISPYDDAKNILQANSVETIIIKDSGHSPMYESSVEFANAMNEFLTEDYCAIEAA